MIRTSKHSVVAAYEGGQAFTASVRTHAVRTDHPVAAGGTDSAPTPLELLSVALASCIALYVQRFCMTRQLSCEDFVVEVKPLWREDPGRIARFDVTLHAPATFPPQYLAAIDEVARTCPVHNTLTGRPEITVQIQQAAAGVSSSRTPIPQRLAS